MIAKLNFQQPLLGAQDLVLKNLFLLLLVLLLLLSMLKIVVPSNSFVKTVIRRFQESLINRKFQRTAFI